MRYFFLFLLSYLPFTSVLNSQSSELTTHVNIETKTNSYYFGELIKITSDSILLYDDDSNLISLGKADVKYFREGNKPMSRFDAESANVSVPYYVQTAFPNGKGNHYYKNYLLFGNEFNFGMTENWNIALGFETASLILDSADQLPTMQLSSKYARSLSKSLNMGISAKYYFNNEGQVLMLGAPITIGNKRTNITFSPTRIHEDGSEYFGIFTNLSLDLSQKSRMVVDYIRTDDQNISAIVFEHLFNSGFTLSFGALITSDGTIPNMSFSLPFGSWKNNYRK